MVWANLELIGLVAALLAGVAIGVTVYAARGWLAARWTHDVEWLQAAALGFSPVRIDGRPYVTAWYALAAVALAALLLTVPGLILPLVIWVLILCLPKAVLNLLWNRRRRRIDLQLAPAITSLANSVQAGYTLVQGIARVARTSPEPIRTEFRIMASRYEHGADLQTTIEEARRRLRLPNFALFASALLVNREMGGNIGQTLDRIAQSLESAEQTRERVKAATSAGRMNIKVLALAPVIILGLVYFIDAEAVSMIFTTSIGHVLLLVAGVLTAIGVYWARLIVSADV
jgi:Flp pilus assembly protein TadB